MKFPVSPLASVLLLGMSGLAHADNALNGGSLGVNAAPGAMLTADQLLGDLGVTAEGMLSELRSVSLSRDILNSQNGASMSRVLGDTVVRRQDTKGGSSALDADAVKGSVGGICKTKLRGFAMSGKGLQRGSMTIAVACMESGGYKILADRSVIELANSGETAVLYEDAEYRRRFHSMTGTTSLDKDRRPASTVGIHRIYAQLVQRNPSLSGQPPPPDAIRVSVDY